VEAIKVELPKTLYSVEVHPFADLHIGDKHCSIEGVKKRIEQVKEKENAYVILNGDIINNATKTSVSDSYAEELSPMEQISRFVELFEPVKDKILCLISMGIEFKY
jgi:predicted MPP superfamily phosphohydrolase